MNTIHLIGCGGAGSFLAGPLARICSSKGLHLVLLDGDRLEPKNLDRQMFRIDQVGQAKASALHDILKSGSATLSCSAVCEYFHEGTSIGDDTPILFCCADNHPARLACINIVDRMGGWAFIGGNETLDAEAYVYRRPWKGSPQDPRVFYPELLTDRSGDPRRPCTGEEVMRERPQTAVANFTSAALQLHLAWFWLFQSKKLSPDTITEAAPTMHRATASSMRSVRGIRRNP